MYNGDATRVSGVGWTIRFEVTKVVRVRIIAPTADYVTLIALIDHEIRAFLHQIYGPLLHPDTISLFSLSTEL